MKEAPGTAVAPAAGGLPAAGTADARPARKAARLHTHLLVPIAAAVIPLAVFGLYAVYALWQSERGYDEERERAQAHAVAASLGKDLEGSIQLLSFMASGSTLSHAQPPEFAAVAQQALDMRSDWQNVLAVDRSGEQVYNSRWSHDRRPNRLSAPHIRAVFDTGRPTVSELFVAPGSGEWRVSVNVPVWRAGAAEHVLIAGLKLSHIDDLLDSQATVEGGFATLIDGEGTIISRSRDGAQRRGTAGNEEILRALKGARAGSQAVESAELGPLAGAWAPVPLTRWAVFIGTPLGTARAELARHLAFVALGGFGALAAGLLVALLMSRKIAHAVASAAEIAAQVPEGLPVRLPETGILELGGLNDALAKAAARISEESAARNAAEHSLNALFQREREAREAAEYANRAKDHFLAMLGHELRNPLAAISNAATVAGWGTATHEQRDHALAVIRRQSGNLTAIVNDLLDASRVMGGKIRLQREPVNLGTVVADAVRALELGGTLASRDVRVAIGDAWVEGDRARLEQVVHNLLANAATYTPAGAAISIGTRVERDSAVLEVADEGIGIAETDLPHVFDLFFQAKQDSHRPYSGLGIGLTVVKQLVLLHGGEVAVHSAGPGTGATFTVRLPAVVPAAAVPRARLDRPQPRRILIVEDNADARDTLRQVLELEGHVVRVAADAESALARLEEQLPEIAIVDIGLPGMDGYALARAIRTRHGGRVRLIALSGYGSDSDRARALHSGFDAHLTKPAETAALNALLQPRPAVTESAGPA